MWVGAATARAHNADTVQIEESILRSWRDRGRRSRVVVDCGRDEDERTKGDAERQRRVGKKNKTKERREIEEMQEKIDIEENVDLV